MGGPRLKRLFFDGYFARDYGSGFGEWFAITLPFPVELYP
jgi:hypothetical protein